ncbi:GMC oxidoreductase [Dothidotthia symphoricarpi CBS 119687]|uniref:GMC oxidoreductase n=1 Tax=Dothidotthia symphoricarpi CBS 119687 TaxID=1392245 RepID=A0A6A6AH08_9PLEO|nr:GMC oxidoreductase [Dothidotthia symphoricarpi CBS 119687]KAF2131229.1 GMC oxidoreductase [Dothidotthia symphoricarpi CBS 119687]
MVHYASKVAVALCAVVASSSAQEQLRTAIPGNAAYDYVVIGGGTAGLAIASRLSAYASVAVIEAGGLYEVDNGNQSVIPYYGLVMPILGITEDYPQNSLIDWDLLSTPQASAGGRRIHYAQGKTLGGSSAINTGAYHRGTVGSYQRWADLVGDQSFTFDRILPYFKRTATLTPPNLKKRNAPNATVLYDPKAFDNSLNGPVQISWANWVDPAQSWFARALQAVGMTLSPNGLSSGKVDGGAWVPTTIDPKDATRSSSKTSYLQSALQNKRARIAVYLRSQASKIIFDKKKRATGVAVSFGGLDFVISAKKEVILSAGVFHSPQILQLSVGIGPASTLRSYSIDVVSDLSGVGQNLWDQIFFNVLRGVSVPNTGTYLATPAQQAFAVQQYLSDAAGPYSSAGGYLSFEKLPAQSRAAFSPRTSELLSNFPSDWPEIEYIASGFPGGFLNLTTVGAISATLLTPTSRGNVTIRSASIADAPVINLGWLTDPADGEVLVAAFKRVRDAWNSTAIAGIVVGPEITPGDAVTTDAQILEYIRSSASPIWHASSTCAMGKAGEAGAVVDSKARVFGVKRLRVVDNSIIPFSLPGHPTSSVYMLAEKIAEDILKGK